MGFVIYGVHHVIDSRWHNSILPTFTFSDEKATKCCYIARLYNYFMEGTVEKTASNILFSLCYFKNEVIHINRLSLRFSLLLRKIIWQNIQKPINLRFMFQEKWANTNFENSWK
ncbi:hypothetical protein ACJX0J_032393 [Zea mays]